jgi:hypothetical protein
MEGFLLCAVVIGVVRELNPKERSLLEENKSILTACMEQQGAKAIIPTFTFHLPSFRRV